MMKVLAMPQYLGALLLSLMATVLTPGIAGGADVTAPLHALLVAGGCCHDYQNQKTILTQGISARANVSWTIVHEGTTREYEMSLYTNADWAAGYDVVVHDECFGSVTNDVFIDRIAAAHYAGVPSVMLHCSTHSYRAAQTDEWRKCLGISSYSHEALRDFTVTNLLPKHPIMRGFPAHWLDPADELYKSEVVWPKVVALAQAYGQETKTNHVVVWANTYGSGRVFSTTLGHGNSTVGQGVYLDLVTRGLLWVCGRLDDTAGPRIMSVQQVTNSMVLAWQSVPGWSYAVQFAPEVTGVWNPMSGGTLTATNVIASATMPNLGAQQRYFRVQLLDP